MSFSTQGLNSISNQVSEVFKEKLLKPFKLIILDWKYFMGGDYW